MACRKTGSPPRTSSGKRNPNGSWCRPPVSAPLNGIGLFGICLPPASECWPELRADSHAVVRRTNPNRRTGSPPRVCSGEANPNRSYCLPPVSAPLNGIGFFGIRLPPASECWPELSADSHPVLRRTKARRRYGFRALAYSGEANPNRSYCLPPVSAPLNGVGLFGIRLPPASECWPELSPRTEAVLRRERVRRTYEFRTLTCSGETTPNRSWRLPPVSAFLNGVAVPTIRCHPVT